DHQRAARIRCRKAGADLPQGQARLPDPRRHSDHAAGRGTPTGVIGTDEFLIGHRRACPGDAMTVTRETSNDQDLGPQYVVERAKDDVGGWRAQARTSAYRYRRLVRQE